MTSHLHIAFHEADKASRSVAVIGHDTDNSWETMSLVKFYVAEVCVFKGGGIPTF